MAVMGQSGSGKTTLLNVLAGRVTKGVTGSITINGEKPTKNSKRFIAYCTQDDTFYPLLTVRESLTYTVSLCTCTLTMFAPVFETRLNPFCSNFFIFAGIVAVTAIDDQS